MKIFTWKQRGIIAGTTFGVVGIFGAAGYFLGGRILTRQLMMIVSVIASFPFTQFLLVRQLNADWEMRKDDVLND